MSSGKIVNLYGPSQERITHISHWYQQQSSCEFVAALNISIAADGLVHTSALGIAPAHAAAMLDSLRDVIGTMQAFIDVNSVEIPPADLPVNSTNVVAFKRQAAAQH